MQTKHGAMPQTTVEPTLAVYWKRNSSWKFFFVSPPRGGETKYTLKDSSYFVTQRPKMAVSANGKMKLAVDFFFYHVQAS